MKTSKYIGVYFHKSIKKWTAEIIVNNKNIHLGSFLNEIEAAKARDKYVIDKKLKRKLNTDLISLEMEINKNKITELQNNYLKQKEDK